MPTGATAPFSQHTPGATPVNQADRADRADRASLRRSRMFHPPTCATADHRYPARPRPPRPRPTTYLPTDHLLLARPRHSRESGGRRPNTRSVEDLVVGERFRGRPRASIPGLPPPAPTTCATANRSCPTDHRYSAKSRPYRSPPTTYVRDDHLLLTRPRHSRESGGRRPNTRSVEDLVVGERFRGRPRASIPGLPPPAPTTCATANRSCPTDHRRHRRPPVVRPLMPQRRSAPTT